MTIADNARNLAISLEAKKDALSQRQNGTTHGFAPRGGRSAEYTVWIGIKTRCNNKNDHNYLKYGARGIRICERWQNSFLHFLQDMGTRPSADHSIERIDNAGHYEPGNCRWATSEEQANNRRSSRFIEFNGERRTIAQWSKCTGIKQDALLMRLRKGWSVERALTQSVRGSK